MLARGILLGVAILVGVAALLGREEPGCAEPEGTEDADASAPRSSAPLLAVAVLERQATLAVSSGSPRASAEEEDWDVEIVPATDGTQVGCPPVAASSDEPPSPPAPSRTLRAPTWIDGELAFVTRLTGPDGPDGAVEYDLSEACGLWGDGDEAIRGPARALTGRDAWGLRLMGALVAEEPAFARGRCGAWMAWDEKQAHLLVGGSDVNLDSVARFLDARATTGGAALAVVVEAARTGTTEPQATLRLEVPWNRRVRALSGASYGYLKDVELEMAQSPTAADLYPIFDFVETGIGITAVRVPCTTGAEGVLELEVTQAADPPVLRAVRTGVVPVRFLLADVEMPDALPAGTRIALPARLGSVARGAAPQGREICVRVLEEANGTTALRPAWRRLPRGEPAPGEIRRISLDMHVRRAGNRGEWSRVPVVSCPDGDWSPSVSQMGDPPETSERFESDSWTARLQAGDGGVIDAVLRIPGVVRTRSVAVAAEGVPAKTFHLPCVRLAVVPLRFASTPDGHAVRRVEIDFGRGPESFDVALQPWR